MPFVPHTEQDIKAMLDVVGVQTVGDLFDEIPENIRADKLKLDDGIGELALAKVMAKRAAQDDHQLNFIGAGSYQHHIPAAVWQLVSRGEFMTAYTPYQAEASQGGLQVIYEYQTMMASLMGMEVSNASLYDGASALAESVLMAVRANRKSTSKTVLVIGALSPFYVDTVNSIVKHQNIVVTCVPTDFESTQNEYTGTDIAAVVLPQPNFFGQIQDVDTYTDWAHAQGALVIGVVNPTAMALLKPPGQWGESGADIACGEGQPLGVPMASGGPYFGFVCCKQVYIRQLPGRIVGRTEDIEGKPGFVLTLQAREQHIRRSKATSNICTNQGLLVTAATIYMSLMGPEGLKRVALKSHQNAMALQGKLEAIGLKVVHAGPHFHEFVIDLPCSAKKVRDALAKQNIQAGFDCGVLGKDTHNHLLVCSTDVHDDEDHDVFVQALKEVCSC
jgi:glycine dehydrogenase subunit 1